MLVADIKKLFEDISYDVHERNVIAGWYTDLNTGKPKERNLGEMLMLMVSEISECMEGVRKNICDDHLTHRSMEEVELADLLIRVFDYVGYRNLDLGGAFLEKLEYNKNRKDHKIENRKNDQGKSF